MTRFDRAITHSGPFHADDVFALAVLKDLEPSLQVMRTRDPEVLSDALSDIRTVVVDVGWTYEPALRNFDHHQSEFRRVRPDGVPFASIGLVWEAFGEAWLEEQLDLQEPAERRRVHAEIDRRLVCGIDAFDCGAVRASNKVRGRDTQVEVASVSEVIASFNPVWFETPNYDDRFIDAIRVASGILKRQAWRALAELRFADYVDERDDGGPVLELEKPGPWRRFVRHHHKLVIFPASGESGWLVQAVGDPESLEFPPPLRISYPEPWRGLAGERLVEEIGLPGATFCHRAGFIGGAATLEAARALAALVLQAHDEAPQGSRSRDIAGTKDAGNA